MFENPPPKCSWFLGIAQGCLIRSVMGRKTEILSSILWQSWVGLLSIDFCVFQHMPTSTRVKCIESHKLGQINSKETAMQNIVYGIVAAGVETFNRA